MTSSALVGCFTTVSSTALFLSSVLFCSSYTSHDLPRDHVTDGKRNKTTHCTYKPRVGGGGGGPGHRNNKKFYNENVVTISQTTNNVHGHGLYTGFHGISKIAFTFYPSRLMFYNQVTPFLIVGQSLFYFFFLIGDKWRKKNKQSLLRSDCNIIKRYIGTYPMSANNVSFGAAWNSRIIITY